MPSNREITFVLKVQNDAKQGLQSVGVDFDSLARRVNDLGTKQGASAQRGLTGIQAQARAIRELIAAYRQAGVAQERLSRLQAQNRAANRVSTARARDAENSTLTREAARVIELRNRQSIAEQRLQRELAKTAQASRLAADAAKSSNARAVSAAQVAQSNAQTVVAINQLRIKESQLRVDKQILKVQQEQARLDAMIAANKAKQTAAAQAQLVLQQRIAAATAQTARQQALAATAAARNQSAGGGRSGGGGRGGILSGFFSGFLGGRGSGSPSAGGAIGGGGNIISGLGTNSSTAALGLGQLRNAAISLGAALGVTKLIEYADAFKLLNARVGIVTRSAYEQTLVFNALADVANESRVGLQEVSTVYYGLARNNQTLGLSQRELLDITETINKSIAVSGTNAQAAAFGLIQLSQAFGTGQLRGEELNSVLEQLPALAQVIAKNIRLANGEIGVGTPGALKTLAEQGRLTISQIIDALKVGAGQIAAEFNKIPPTVNQGLTVVKNGLIVFIGEIDKAAGVTVAIAKAFSNLGKALSSDEYRRIARNFGDALASAGEQITSALSPVTQFLSNNFIQVLRLVVTAIGAVVAALVAFKVASASIAVFSAIGTAATASAGAMAATAVAVRSLGKAFLINSALLVSWTRTAGVASTASLVLGTSLRGAAVGLRALTAASIAFIKTPLGIALLAASVTAGYLYDKLSQDVEIPANAEIEKLGKQAKTTAEATVSAIDAIRQKATTADGSIDVSKISDQDFTVIAAYKQNIEEQISQLDDATKQAIVSLGQNAVLVEEAKKNLAKALSEDNAVQETRTRNGERRLIKNEAVKNAENALAEAEKAYKIVQDGAVELDARRKVLADSYAQLLDFDQLLFSANPSRKGTDPSSEIQRVFDRVISESRPAIGKLREQAKEFESIRTLFADPQDLSFASFQKGSNRDSTYLRELTKTYFGLSDAFDLSSISTEKQFEAVTALMRDLQSLARETPLSAAFRESTVELEMLTKEAEQGALPVQRRLLEVAKQLAQENEGVRGDPRNYMKQVDAALRERYEAEETQRILISSTEAIRARNAELTAGALTLGAITPELRAQAEIEKLITEARAKNAEFTTEQAEQIKKAKDDYVKLFQDQQNMTVFGGLTEEFRKLALEKEKLDRLMGVPPNLADAEEAYVSMLAGIADQAKMTIQDVERLIQAAGGQPIKIGNTEIPTENLDKSSYIDNENAKRRTEIIRDSTRAVDDLVFIETEYAKIASLGADEAERRRREIDLALQLFRAGMPAEAAMAQASATYKPAVQAEENTANQNRDVQGMINGAKRGFADFLRESADVATQTADIIKNAFGGIGSAIAQLVTTGKANFKELAASILRDIATMIVKFLVLQAIMAALRFIPGGSAVLQLAGLVKSEKGNVFEAGKHVQKYARGGLVTRPTFFPMANGGLGLMGEAGAEAIMPLRRLSNGRLGVEGTGGGTTNNVFSPSIVITVEGGSSKDRDENENLATNIGDQVNKIMEAKMAEFAQRQSRNGGMLRTALEL